MARLISALHDRSAPTSVLVATSGDTGSAVAHAFYRVPHTRVLVLYPDGRVSPQQQAQMAMFNAEPDTNVRAYAVAGNFDDCQRLVKAASADRRRARAGAGDIGQFDQHRPAAAADGVLLPRRRASSASALGALPPDGAVVSTPSGNFGNLTAGLMAKRAGLPIARFVAATNVNDVVPVYLSHRPVRAAAVAADALQRDGRRPPEQLRSHAVDVRRTSTRCAPTSSAAGTWTMR